ncbi:MAG: tyrosine--tRNA ligase [Candidatus Omnitrophica bacterium]|nr:tyrosine--tRNA ligase [Candidatus Omnitrophota bacterium]MBD3268710.1 tyrosine--tRNA ligase [Candidatus Omnitrophota bacterium]
MDKRIAEHLKLFKENTVDFLCEEEIISKLKKSFSSKNPLKLKIGFDPTAKDIHLGHTVLLRKLRKLQDSGHRVYLIIGDFTARIGDPSGRTALRPVLSDEEIKDNASTYTQQAFKILDRKKTEIIYNSIWYKNMKLTDFLSLLSSYTLARILERDDFSKRVKNNKPLTVLEIIYPLIQGYDSCRLEADVEFGGTDQKFNLIVGRHLQQALGQEPQAVITMPLLIGLDGNNKMSKSLNNYVGITESPKEMFGKLMSIPDKVMWEYFRLLTDYSLDKAQKMHPKEAKESLAREIVSFYYNAEAAESQKQEFRRVFSRKELPSKIKEYRVKSGKIDLVEVLYQSGTVTSKNEARRLLNQKAISVSPSKEADYEPVESQELEINAKGKVLKVGKKRFLKLIPPD